MRMITHGNRRNAPARSGSADDRLIYHYARLRNVTITCPPKTGDILHNSTIAVSPDPLFRVRVWLARLVVCVCVCVRVCVQAAHLRLTQLSDKLDILTDLVSCWLQHEFGIIEDSYAYDRTVVGHFYTRNGLIFRIPSVYYACDFTRAVNLYAHV